MSIQEQLINIKENLNTSFNAINEIISIENRNADILNHNFQCQRMMELLLLVCIGLVFYLSILNSYTIDKIEKRIELKV